MNLNPDLFNSTHTQYFPFIIFAIVVVQLLNCVQLFATLCTVACQASLFPTISPSLLKFMSTGLVMLSNHLILFCLLPLLQYFPVSGAFPISRIFTLGGQSTRASASGSVLPVNSQGLFPLGLTGLITLQSKGLSRVFSSTTV